MRETPPEQVRPPRLISGDDLIALGLKPGPEFKCLLEAVEEAQLNGSLASREQIILDLNELGKGRPYAALGALEPS